MENIIGKKYGRLTVESMYDNRYAICRCDCGNQKKICKYDVINGKTKSCGCLHIETSASINPATVFAGDKFGMLTVVKELKERRCGERQYECICECGRTRNVKSSQLRNGNITHCGDYSNKNFNLLDITGRVSGSAKAIRFVERKKNRNGSDKWESLCLNCGSHFISDKRNFLSGNTKSCGCMKESAHEQQVERCLQFLKLDYQKQVKFDGLIGNKGAKLSYDFAILNDGKITHLIECQGQQHYKPVTWYGGEEQFNIQQMHDSLKREYAKNNSIKLIEIKYNLKSNERVLRKITKELKLNYSEDILNNFQSFEREVLNYDNGHKEKDVEAWKKHLSEAHNNDKIKVYAYDLDGNYVREFESISEAERVLKTSDGNIKTAIDKKGTAKGYQLRYCKKEKIEKYHKNGFKSVKAVSNQRMLTFDTISESAVFFGKSNGTICSKIRGNRGEKPIIKLGNEVFTLSYAD